MARKRRKQITVTVIVDKNLVDLAFQVLTSALSRLKYHSASLVISNVETGTTPKGKK